MCNNKTKMSKNQLEIYENFKFNWFTINDLILPKVFAGFYIIF